VVRSTYQSWSRKDEDYLMSEKRFKLVYEGRELSTLLSEEGKFEAMQKLSMWFDEGREGAIDPDKVTVVDVLEEKES